jgi:hypothetical protein
MNYPNRIVSGRCRIARQTIAVDGGRCQDVRWDSLFADLEAQAEALSAAERSAEVEDRTRFEIGRISVHDRLAAVLNSEIRLRCSGGLWIAGRLRRSHPEWLLVEQDGVREVLVLTTGIVSIAGLSRSATTPGQGSATEAVQTVRSGLGVRYALRGVVRDRSSVRMHLTDGTVLAATLDRVGADFIDCATHAEGEARRWGEVREVLTVPITALVALYRDA